MSDQPIRGEIEYSAQRCKIIVMSRILEWAFYSVATLIQKSKSRKQVSVQQGCTSERNLNILLFIIVFEYEVKRLGKTTSRNIDHTIANYSAVKLFLLILLVDNFHDYHDDGPN